MGTAEQNSLQHFLDEIWGDLSAGIRDVYDQRKISTERFMQLYTQVYNYCTGYESLEATREKRPIKRARTTEDFHGNSGPVCQNLHERIMEFVNHDLLQLAEIAKDDMNESLLTLYCNAWEGFIFSSKVLNGFCSYLNRSCNSQGNQGEIYQQALSLWKGTIFEPLNTSLISTILKLIDRDRNGETVNISLIKVVTDSLVALGETENNQPSWARTHFRFRYANLSIYKTYFENQFIQETTNYYIQESAFFLQSGEVSGYMKRVEQRLLEERKRAQLCLHSSTLEPLIKCCENVLIESHLDTLRDEFPILLRAEQVDEIGRMYNLISNFSNSFGNMTEILQTYITQAGSDAIFNNADKCRNNSREYIQTILQVYQKFSDLVATAFKNNHLFVLALEKGCAVFINSNILTDGETEPHKTPEMLARYCDLLLRKSEKSDCDEYNLEEKLNQAMTIFKFIQDKDVFQKYYSRLLAHRLSGNFNKTDEFYIISKLRMSCGYDFTVNLQRMLLDVGLSKSMTQDFQTWLQRQDVAIPFQLDFDMMVLKFGSWPFTTDTANGRFRIPEVLESYVTSFSQYYSENHIGQNLKWLHSKSHGEIETNCFSQNYTLMLSTYSIAVLLQYNDRDSYKLGELMEATNLQEDTLTQTVQVLMRAGILKLDDDKDKLSPTSEVYLFKDFESQKLKINLRISLKTDVKAEEERAQASIKEWRIHEVQAAIIRIMKTRKVIGHQELMSELSNQLQSRFSPNVQLVKRCIDSLIDKEYLRRVTDDNNAYEYVSS